MVERSSISRCGGHKHRGRGPGPASTARPAQLAESTLADVRHVRRPDAAITSRIQATVRTLTLHLSEVGNHSKVWSRGVVCSDWGFQRITLVGTSNRCGMGQGRNHYQLLEQCGYWNNQCLHSRLLTSENDKFLKADFKPPKRGIQNNRRFFQFFFLTLYKLPTPKKTSLQCQVETINISDRWSRKHANHLLL